MSSDRMLQQSDDACRPVASSSRWRGSALSHITSFILGGAIVAAALSPVLIRAHRPNQHPEAHTTEFPAVDFSFQVLGVESPRQENKTLNTFVRLRYPRDETICPYHPTRNDCYQYQNEMRTIILRTLMEASDELPLAAEWERVNVHLCRAIWNAYPLAAISVSLHVNGDGRHGAVPYEPGAHGATCTIGPNNYPPIDFYNRLPNLGPY